MAIESARRDPIEPSAPLLRPRLSLATARVDRAVLDGAWWPRSWDPVAELPGLVLALADRYGPIRYVLLNSGIWDNRFRRLVVGTTVLRLGWFATLDPALAIAISTHDVQLDLLVVPPTTTTESAEHAMTTAASPASAMHAPDILASEAVPSDATGTATLG